MCAYNAHSSSMSAISVSFQRIISFSKKDRCIIVEITQNGEYFQNISVPKKTSGKLEK